MTAVRTTQFGEVSLVDAVHQKYGWDRNRCAARVKRHLQLHPYKLESVQRHVFKNRGGRKDGTYVAKPAVAEQIVESLVHDFGRKTRSAPGGGTVLRPRDQPLVEVIPALTRHGECVVDATTALAELGPDTAEPLFPAFHETQTTISVLPEIDTWGPPLQLPEYEFCGPEEEPFTDQEEHVDLSEGYQHKFF